MNKQTPNQRATVSGDSAPRLPRLGPLTRRQMLRGSGLALTGAASAMLVGCGGDEALPGLAPVGPPEVTRIRMPAFDGASLCLAPLYLAEPFLREEGIDVDYVPFTLAETWPELVDSGAFDFAQDFAASTIVGLDKKRNFSIVGGVHAGCTELFARDGTTLADLKGARIAVPFGETPTNPDYAFMLTLLDFIGIPSDRVAVSTDLARLPSLLLSGEIDGAITVAPFGHELHNTKGVSAILDTSVDRPWVDYYCCVFFANHDFIRKNPNTMRRTLRAVFRGVDRVAREPELAARSITELGFPLAYEDALALFRHMPYDRWRTVAPEDSLRFYALRLNESGRIKSTPDKLIARGTDFRFLNELKKELAFLPAPGPKRASLFNCDIEQGPRS